jgi:transposase
LLLHRHQWVRMRTRVQNALQAIALAHGLRRGAALWNQEGQRLLAKLPLAEHEGQRRTELQELYAKLEANVKHLDYQVGERAFKRAGARRLMTHPGVGPITALATEVYLGDPGRVPPGHSDDEKPHGAHEVVAPQCGVIP